MKSGCGAITAFASLIIASAIATGSLVQHSPNKAESAGTQPTYIEDDNAPMNSVFQAEVLGNKRFVVHRLGNHHANIEVYIDGKLLYNVPDIEAWAGGDLWEPGDTAKVYDFYLSPDKQLLLVVRGLTQTLTIAYLYRHSKGTSMVPVLIRGQRLDEAAVENYAAIHHLDPNFLGYARVFAFDNWSQPYNRIHYDMFAASYWWGEVPSQSDDILKAWRGVFDPVTHRFTGIRSSPPVPRR